MHAIDKLAQTGAEPLHVDGPTKHVSDGDPLIMLKFTLHEYATGLPTGIVPVAGTFDESLTVGAVQSTV